MMENKKNVGLAMNNENSGPNERNPSRKNIGIMKNEEKYLPEKNLVYGNCSERSSSSDSNIRGYDKEKSNRNRSSSRSPSLDEKKRRSSMSNEVINRVDDRKNIESNIFSNKSHKGKSSEHSDNLKVKKVDKVNSRPNSRSPNRNFRKSSGMKFKITNLISEKNANKIFYPGLDGPLVSLSLFNELQHNILPNDVIESAYKEYKEKYDEKRFKSFYVEHQNDEWFKEKYDPECSKQYKAERNAQCQKLANRFIESLTSNQLKNLKLELREADENNKHLKIFFYGYNKEKGDFEEKEREINLLKSANVSDTTIDICSMPYYGFDPDKLTLFAYQIPKSISRFQILKIVKKLPGFVSMSMSEPIKNQNYCRYCWMAFDSEENCELAFDSLNDYKLTNDYKLFPIKSKSTTSKKLRVTVPYFEERISEDLEFSKALIQIYDKERAIETNSILDNKETRSREYQLDLQILYLRRVHGLCYYCLEEYEDERMLATRCDNIHLRHHTSLSQRKQETIESHKYEVEWDKQFTKLIKEKIENGLNSLKKPAIEVSDELNRRRNDYCKENTSYVSAERYLCNLCSKMFKGPNFVYNHIFNKHLNLIEENVDKQFYDNIKYENYLKDPNKLYEKYKIINNMEEYLQYLNTVSIIKAPHHHDDGDSRYGNYKKIPSPTSRQPYDREKERPRDRDRERENVLKHKRYNRDFKDLDNPEHKSSGSSRQLISYDDL